MARIFWDTNIFIYLLEANPQWLDAVASLHGRMVERGDRLVTSWLTVGEITTRPRRLARRELEQRYLAYFASDEVELVAFGKDAATCYATVRAQHNIRPADALQLACAAAARSDLFVTNDRRLHRITTEGIGFVTGLERLPL